MTYYGLASPLPYTLLSLGRYAQIMGIAPPHFMRALCNTSPPIFPYNQTCSSLWPRYSWQQHGQVSHEELAYAIQSAEQEIARIIGYYPAPMWIYEEIHDYPRPFWREAFGTGINIRNRYKGVKANYGWHVESGRRAVSIIDTVTKAGGDLVYSDEDADGMYDTATITVATALTNAQEIKVYFADCNGDQEWEIRPVRSKTIAGGVCTIVIDAWFFIDPEILAQYPTDAGVEIADLQDVNDLVESVDVYREYTDTTQASAQFLWESSYAHLCSCGSTDCEICSQYTMDGCLSARDKEHGYLLPAPATYDSDNAIWDRTTCSECPEPEMVRLWYYAGYRDDAYKSGRIFDPLSDFWAQTIAWVATARLGRPLCECNNIHAFAESLREDVTISTRDSSRFIAREDLSCPLGTRYGEIMAWRRMKNTVKKHFSVAIVP